MFQNEAYFVCFTLNPGFKPTHVYLDLLVGGGKG